MPAGSGQDVSNFVFLWVGTGIGLGIIVDGRLYRGAAGAAGEIAYLPVGPGDPHDRAYRRRGQLEETAAAAAVDADRARSRNEVALGQERLRCRPPGRSRRRRGGRA